MIYAFVKVFLVVMNDFFVNYLKKMWYENTYRLICVVCKLLLSYGWSCGLSGPAFARFLGLPLAAVLITVGWLISCGCGFGDAAQKNDQIIILNFSIGEKIF